MATEGTLYKICVDITDSWFEGMIITEFMRYYTLAHYSRNKFIKIWYTEICYPLKCWWLRAKRDFPLTRSAMKQEYTLGV